MKRNLSYRTARGDTKRFAPKVRCGSAAMRPDGTDHLGNLRYHDHYSRCISLVMEYRRYICYHEAGLTRGLTNLEQNRNLRGRLGN